MNAKYFFRRLLAGVITFPIAYSCYLLFGLWLIALGAEPQSGGAWNALPIAFIAWILLLVFYPLIRRLIQK